MQPRRRGGPETWGVNAEQLELPSAAGVAVTKTGIRRTDAFTALAGSLSRHQRQAADYLILDLAELYGVAGSWGVAGTERIGGSPAHTLMSERKAEARKRLERTFARVGHADQALLLAIAEPIVLHAATAPAGAAVQPASEEEPPAGAASTVHASSWRDVVARVTGERQPKPQATRVRAALENLRLAYGIGPAPRLHPFGGVPLQQPIGGTSMAVSALNGAPCASPPVAPPTTALGPQGRGRVDSGPVSIEPAGRFVLQRVLLFTQVSERPFFDKGERSSGVSWARALAAYLLNVELEISQHECARILPLTQPSIVAAVRRVEDLREEDPALNEAIDRLAESVRRAFAPAANDN